MKTELKNRTLWFDGTQEVLADGVSELILAGTPIEKIVVSSSNEDTDLYNLLSDIPLDCHKDCNSPLDFTWKIPAEYQSIDVEAHCFAELSKIAHSKNLDAAEYSLRLAAELKQVKTRKLENLIRSLVYVVDKFRSNSVVWGVGRGSSCASLILWIIGLHKVDPIKYGIPLEEFFHD